MDERKRQKLVASTKKGIRIIDHMLDGPLRDERRRRILRDAVEGRLRDGYRIYFQSLHDFKGEDDDGQDHEAGWDGGNTEPTRGR